MPRGIKTVRWTISFAETEFLQRREKIAQALKTAGENPGPDGKWSTIQIVRALFVHEALALEAKAARHRSQIDEAEMTKLRREAEEGRLIERKDVRERLGDGLTKIAQAIRQSKLSEKDRRIVLEEVRSIKLP